MNTNLYSVFIRETNGLMVAAVYQLGDRKNAKVLPEVGYRTENAAIAAIKRKLNIPSGKKNILLHREPWTGRIETIGWR